MMKTKEEYVKNLKVLYEDNHIIVIEKPVNVLSQKDITNDIDINEIVKEYIKIKYNKPGNVYLGLLHRLDRRVGGVMVLAKSSKAASRLSEDIRNNKFDKYYIAKCSGKINKNGSINIKILKDEKTKMAIVSDKGKDSRLNYKVVGYDNNDTYCIVNLITGRYNQIRCSFNYINHPLINDYKYSKGKVSNDEIGLYCYKIGFTHPVTKEYLEFSNIPNTKMWEKLDINNLK